MTTSATERAHPDRRPRRRGPVFRCLLTLAVGALFAASARGEPPERLLIGQQFEVHEPTVWRGVRVTLFPPPALLSEPLELVLLGLGFEDDPACGGSHEVTELQLLGSTEVDLAAWPVIERGSVWIGVPAKDELWLDWHFDPPVGLVPDTTYLVALDVPYAEAAAGRVVVDFTFTSSDEEASLVSFDGGDTFACLDEALALSVVGIEEGVEENNDGSPLLRLEIEPEPEREPPPEPAS